ncbi:SCAN domain-containing protein 3 [Collichthys lucidus]|uniref:SCAN domain-containing protein 3 n=1 Tax=Collichthys lucidus TaxID=240159 RepID=A0A4U5U765_COLLU|nr:SCAN domain-containing protein 3 [Collichthys lucidus]
MTGSVKGLLGQVKKVNPKIKWMHCIIHREALASKRMSPDLSAVMDDAVKIINFIHSRPLNHRLFETLCHESGARHDQLLLHTDVRWLSRGKTLLRLYELRGEVCAFLKEQLHPLSAGFEDDNWVARLGYLADVFTKLNELNLSLQGKDSHILRMYEKVEGFTKKLNMWQKKCEEGDVIHFPLLHAHLVSSAVTRAPAIKLVEEHLSKLSTDFNQYFQDIDKKSESLDWVRGPYTTTKSSNKLPARLQEQLLDVSSDRSLRVAHKEKTLTEFWCGVEKEYPELRWLSFYLLDQHICRRNNSVQSRVGAARQSEPFNEHWSRRAFTETWLNRPNKRIRSPNDFWTAIGRDGLASTRPGCLIMHFAPCARLTWTLVTKGQQVTNTVPHTQIPPFHNVSVTPSSIRQLGEMGNVLS